MTLGVHDLITFSQTAQPEKAKAFYGDVLGLTLSEDNPFAIIFRSGRTSVRNPKGPELLATPIYIARLAGAGLSRFCAFKRRFHPRQFPGARRVPGPSSLRSEQTEPVA
jgi:catechol 2,3-dioxygenase-like lactoylglutathione lyase family enzyme